MITLSESVITDLVDNEIRGRNHRWLSYKWELELGEGVAIIHAKYTRVSDQEFPGSEIRGSVWAKNNCPIDVDLTRYLTASNESIA